VARVVDRRRMVDESLALLPPGSPGRAMKLAELDRLRHRSRLLFKALRLLYAALGGFAGSALIAVIGSAMAFYEQKVLFQALAAVGLIVGVISVAALVAASVTLVNEVRLALDSIGVEESEHARMNAG
jgi:predicted membrane metal-binding protein